MRARRLSLSVVLTALLVGGCAGVGGGATVDPGELIRGPAAPADLDGRTFLSIDAAGRMLVPGSQVRLSFGDGQVSAHAGCNTMGGAYLLADGRLVAGQLTATEMACAPALMDQDRWLADLLGGADVALDGVTLTLTGDGGVLILQDREVADPDRPLVGTPWVVEGLVSGDAVASLPAGVTAALTFEDDRVAVESGCNTGGGGYALDGAILTFEPLATTMMACEGPAMEVERAVLTVLAGSVTYEIDADTLRLDTGALGLVLRAAP